MVHTLASMRIDPKYAFVDTNNFSIQFVKMARIAHDALMQRLKRSGHFHVLQKDFHILTGLPLEFHEVVSDEEAEERAFQASLGAHVVFKVGAVKIGYIQLEEEVSQEKAEAACRMLEMAVENISQKIIHPMEAESGVVPGAISKAAEILRKRYHEPLSLGEVAHAVGLSRERLSRLFHASLGITFSDYLNQVRLEHCREALQNSSRNIAEIAFACGFQSISQFNRRFKAAEGVSPRQYRLSHK